MPAAAGAADAGAADQGVKPSCCCVPPRLLLTLLLLHSQPTFGLAGINETTTSTSSAPSMCLPTGLAGGWPCLGGAIEHELIEIVFMSRAHCRPSP